MATLALSVAGQFAGALVGGPFGATIGRALGALAGSAIDNALFGEKTEAPTFDVRLGGSIEGASVPRLYGWGRLSGNIIWARELVRLADETAGAKGFGSSDESEDVGASFAIGLCEGRVARLGRIWADGQVLDTRGLNFRFYDGSENQLPDSLIEATQGSGNAPAYRGLCYIVFENLPLSRFGNRIPQISVRLCRVVGDLEPGMRAVTVIPGATEFGYDPAPRLRVLGPGQGVSENAHLQAGVSDWTCSIDELQDLCPNLEHVALVVSWFGDDLRCADCAVTPRVEAVQRDIEGTNWSVAGYGRADVPVVTAHNGGPAYGGTPSDNAVLAAIADLRARGLKVTLYPLMLMDIPTSNGLPDPHGAGDQGAYPWRGRITCHPAPGQGGSPQGTAGARTQVEAFLPGYRAMVLHYAGLAAASGADALLIGSEMVGLTTVRGTANSFPFVEALVALAADVRAVVGSGTKLTYAADWSEYSGCGNGGEKFFHLDPLWAAPQIDAVGIDCYMPLADWRDGEGHADLGVSQNGYDLDYLAGNIAGGEGFDWFYASAADRQSQTRTPITDGAYGQPWVWRYKDIHAFWSQPHHDRPGGVRSASPTAWVAGSKPIWLTELGCGAVDKGANQPNIFGDEKSAEDGRPHFSRGTPDGLVQRQVLRAHQRYWSDPTSNPAGMVDTSRVYCWTWDARPYPAFPALADIWADGPNHRTGHWLTGRLGALASDELISAIALHHGCAVEATPAAPLIGGVTLSGPGTTRDAIEPVLEITGQVLHAQNGVLIARDGMTGGGPDLAIEDLAGDDSPIVARRRGQASERPARLTLAHQDRERDYLSATAMAIRPGSGPSVAQSGQLVLDGAGARLAAERLLDARAAEDDRLELALPPNRMEVEAGDQIVLSELEARAYQVTEIRDGATRRIVARAMRSRDAVATGVDRPIGASGRVVPAIVPVVVAAHLPALPVEPERTRLILGAYADPWPGVVRITDETSGAALTNLTRGAVMGAVEAGMGAGPFGVWDRANVLEITLFSGHLADAPETAVLAGANRFMVETDDGEWEVIGFAAAELIAPRRYRLSRLLRGLDGTDAAISTVSPGNRVMLFDGRVSSLPVEMHRIGEVVTMRCFAGMADVTGQRFETVLAVSPALPLPPAHLSARRLDNGDIAFGWVRRSRADGDGWGVSEPPLDVVPELYRLRILDGLSAVRVMETSSAGAVYALAEQTADFGGAAPAFDFTINQVSPVLGDGLRAGGVHAG